MFHYHHYELLGSEWMTWCRGTASSLLPQLPPFFTVLRWQNRPTIFPPRLFSSENPPLSMDYREPFPLSKNVTRTEQYKNNPWLHLATNGDRTWHCPFKSQNFLFGQLYRGSFTEYYKLTSVHYVETVSKTWMVNGKGLNGP